MATKLSSLIKTGFGLGIGVFFSQILFLLIGAAFFVPGYLMFVKQQNEENPDQTNNLILMGIGVLLMGGIGFSLLMENASELFE